MLEQIGEYDDRASSLRRFIMLNLSRRVVYIGSMAIAGVINPNLYGQPNPASPLSAQVGSGTGARKESPSAAPALTVEQRLTLLETQINVALALKEEKIQDIKDRIESFYKLVQYAGVAATVLLVLLSIRDLFLRWKEGQRQLGLDTLAKEMMTLQNASVRQQVEVGGFQLSNMHANPTEQFKPVKGVGDVIETVQKTLQFRLEQEERVANAIKGIDKITKEQERIKNQRFDNAIGILGQFKKTSRMEFSALTDEQYKRAIRLQGLVADLDESLKDRGVDIAGRLLYTCGVTAYYDNDVIEAISFLDRAANCRAADHDAELKTNDDYRTRFAHIHYFRALVQKNWGNISTALHEIQESRKLFPAQSGEFLTPVTEAEILSYIAGQEQQCRRELRKLYSDIQAVEVSSKSSSQAGPLSPVEGPTEPQTDETVESEEQVGSERQRGLNVNQRRLRNRTLVLLGNTHFVLGEYREALKEYEMALEFNRTDYYASYSAAQCYRALTEDKRAQEEFAHCFAAIEASRDFRRKRERIVRAVIAVIAAKAARFAGDDDHYHEYAREARDLLDGNLDVGELSPKFFSPSKKRLVNASELLIELGERRIAGAS
jgi:tetratricopeptide (TPR) repeat protein